MSQEGQPDSQPRHANEAGADEAPVKARYEQSHPGKSHQSNDRPDQPTSSSRLRVQNSMALSHATSSITDGGESSYSYNSARDLNEYFHEMNGRKFSSQASTYALPADETEFWRLNKQHAAFLIALGGLYPCPDLVESVLAPREGETIEIVDLGCGTGTWAISMARRFPYARVLGIDLVPAPINPEKLTPNIRFEIDDINLGLSDYAGRFDLVHMRCVGGGLPHYAQAITYAAQCVKPGGLLLVLDLDLQLCAEESVSYQKMATPNQPDGSWLQRYMYGAYLGVYGSSTYVWLASLVTCGLSAEFRHAYSVNGTDIFEAEEMLDRGLWEYPQLDACGAASLYIPVGPWAKSTDLEEAQRLEFGGILMRQNFRNALRGFQTLMMKNGIPQNTLDEWVSKCDTELDSLTKHSWIRLRMSWGRRNAADPASTSLSTLTRSHPLDIRISAWKGHRQVHIYHSVQECLDARKKRFDTLGESVEPLVLKAT